MNYLIVFVFLLVPSNAFADKIDEGVREQYLVNYGVAKGRAGYDCRQRKFSECFKKSWDKSTWWDKYISDKVGDECPGVHSKEMYEACEPEIDAEFPDLE